MRRTMMKSKIHRATVTGADLNYVGSITLDRRLMKLADIMEHEQVHVLDIDNGARFETYAIAGGDGEAILNGAAARLVHPGDRVIVITYAEYEDAELEGYAPKVVNVDSRNRPTDEAFQALNRELHDLAPFLNGKPVPGLKGAPDSVAATLRRHRRARCLIAANLRDETVMAAFKIPKLKGHATVDVYGEGRHLDADNGEFADGFPPYAVHVYRIED